MMNQSKTISQVVLTVKIENNDLRQKRRGAKSLIDTHYQSEGTDKKRCKVSDAGKRSKRAPYNEIASSSR
jgi:hypothetical protein